jgi:hypothetical protein
VRHRRLGSLVGDPQRGAAQPRQPAQQRGGEGDREQGGDREGDDRGDQEAVADLADQRRHLAQLALSHEHAEQPVAGLQRPRDEHGVAFRLGGRLAQPGHDRHVQRARRRRPELAVIDEPLACGVDTRGLHGPVLQQDARVRALGAQPVGLLPELEAVVLPRGAGLLEPAEPLRERFDVLVDR